MLCTITCIPPGLPYELDVYRYTHLVHIMVAMEVFAPTGQSGQPWSFSQKCPFWGFFEGSQKGVKKGRFGLFLHLFGL